MNPFSSSRIRAFLSRPSDPVGSATNSQPTTGADEAFSLPATLARTSGAKPTRTERRKSEAFTDLTLSSIQPHTIHTRGAAPVIPMTRREMISALADMKTDLNKNCKPQKSTLRFSRDIKRAIEDLKKKSAWNTRLRQTNHEIDELIEYCKNNPAETFGYVSDGKLVGALVMEKRFMDSGEAPYIAGCVTYPGTKGRGSALLERAVNASEQWGGGGKVGLIAGNGAADKVWRHMGFKKARSVPGYRLLDPSSSDQWTKMDGEWKIAKHVGREYFESLEAKQSKAM